MTRYSLIYNRRATGGGGFTDWFVSVKKRPGFTPEISKPVYETNPPLSEFPNAWKENQAVSLYVASEGSKLFNQRNYSSLQSKYKVLQPQAKKLQAFYYHNIKTESSLKIEKNFTSLYNSVKNERNRLALQTSKLYSSNRSKLAPYQKEINLQLGYSEKYITAISAGEKLKTLQNSYLKAFEDGKLSANTVLQQQQLINTTSTATKSINNLYGTTVKRLATVKYIDPAMIAKENTMYEVTRFKLTSELENLLKSGNDLNLTVIQAKLDELEKIEIEAVTFKEDKINRYPGKYKVFVKTETMLASKKAAIKAELEKLTTVPENQENTP
jgi:g-D-glutamyl-meso-diaminopimelate peptidase